LYARVERRVAEFVRTNRRWRNGDGHGVLTVTIPDRYQRAVRIAPGWSLIGEGRWQLTDWFASFALRDERGGHVYQVQPLLSHAERWRGALERDSLGHAADALHVGQGLECFAASLLARVSLGRHRHQRDRALRSHDAPHADDFRRARDIHGD
jgi:hypothetical protein